MSALNHRRFVGEIGRIAGRGEHGGRAVSTAAPRRSSGWPAGGSSSDDDYLDVRIGQHFLDVADTRKR